MFSNDYSERAIRYLPPRVAAALRERGVSDIEEIRLIASARASYTVSGKTVLLDERVTPLDMTTFIRRVCGNSFYAQSDNLKEGFIITPDGIRVGVAGRAVTTGDNVISVADVSCAVIRIPSRRPGFADELYSIMKKADFRKNVLVYSPPCGGKTTLLRELVHLLSASSPPCRVAVVDTRFEICEGLAGDHAMRLAGYPRGAGMEIAARTLSPDIIVCDEINSDSDLSAIESAVGCGAAVVASCHATSSTIERRKIVQMAKDKGIFDIFYEVKK